MTFVFALLILYLLPSAHPRFRPILHYEVINPTQEVAIFDAAWTPLIHPRAANYLELRTRAYDGGPEYIERIQTLYISQADIPLYIVLEPGETIFAKVDLSEFFDLTKPGIYSVRSVPESTEENFKQIFPRIIPIEPKVFVRIEETSTPLMDHEFSEIRVGYWERGFPFLVDNHNSWVSFEVTESMDIPEMDRFVELLMMEL